MTDTSTGSTSPTGGDQVRILPSDKRVRAVLGGQLVVDTIHPRLVWEIPHYPAYYLPRKDVLARLEPSGRTEHSTERGEATYYDVHVGEAVARDGAWAYPDSPVEELRDLVRFEWQALDEWLEEDELVYVHPRSPYSRVDVLASSRRVQVMVDGIELADSSRPHILFETGLPPRYYLPLSDVRTELLAPSERVTQCPYKGTATYWSVQVGDRRYDDFAWMYRSPLAESAKVAGMVCFYNERVDLIVDGVPQERPRTPFS
jgi:uncharacterized protein (DUF427 family)